MDGARIGKIALGLGALWYAVLRGARALVVKISDYSFRSIDVASYTVSMNLNLLIKNPLLVGLTIKGIVGDVYAQGMKVGNVDMQYNYYIAGGRTHILPVVVVLDMTEVGQAALLNIQSGDIRTLTIAFNGHILVGKKEIAIPLQLDLDYNDLVR